MSVHELHTLLATAWVVWFFLLFGGIIAWALRPSRRDAFERARQLPLRDAG
jgi:cytochrome c oxidase cbb3-type subunit 4